MKNIDSCLRKNCFIVLKSINENLVGAPASYPRSPMRSPALLEDAGLVPASSIQSFRHYNCSGGPFCIYSNRGHLSLPIKIGPRSGTIVWKPQVSARRHQDRSLLVLRPVPPPLLLATLPPTRHLGCSAMLTTSSFAINTARQSTSGQAAFRS